MSRGVSLRESVFRSIYQNELYGTRTATGNLIASSKDSLDYVQRLGLLCNLPVHMGCVNTVCWNASGEYLLSGSDDQCIAITNPHNQQVLLKYKTAHRANIFSAQFMPQSNDQSIVSCSGDGIVLHTELLAPYMKRGKAAPIYHSVGAGSSGSANTVNSIPIYERSDKDANINFFNCHKSGTTYEVLTMPNESRSFMSCGEDGTVRLFDLRQISSCHKTCCKDNILIFSPSAVNSMDLSPLSSYYLAVGSSDAIVRIYDRRYLSVIDFSDSTLSTKERHTRPVKAYPIPLPTKRHYRVTCVKFSPDETELLVSYSSEYLYLFDLQREGIDVNELSANGRSSGSDNNNSSSSSTPTSLTAVTRRLRLRGDWSDTGPDARPERESMGGRVEMGQVRPQLQANIMSRMTEVISRMLNDPRTRLGLTSQAAAQTVETNRENQAAVATREHNEDSIPTTSNAWRSAATRSLNHARSVAAAAVLQDSTLSEEAHESQPISAIDNLDANSGSISNDNDNNNTQLQSDEAAAAASLNAELAELDMEGKDIVFDYMRMKFVGHRNARTMIKEANFWGNNYIMCGSDCGHIFTWDRRSGKLVKLMRADQHVVNCLQPHPELPYLASSGIDYDIKIWAPILEKPNFDEVEAEDLMKRNAIMLEQTKDTITVPATFMIRMLACIHSLQNRDRILGANAANNATGSVDAEIAAANNNDAAAPATDDDTGSEDAF